MAKRILVLGNGLVGSEVQAIGLAKRFLIKKPTTASTTSTTANNTDWCKLDDNNHEDNIIVGRFPPTTMVQKLPTIIHNFLATLVNDAYFGYNRLLVEDALSQYKPDLIIGCGRSTSMLNRGIKKMNPAITTVQILNPYLNPTNFDFVILPRHDAKRYLFSSAAVLTSATHFFLTTMFTSTRNRASTFAPTSTDILNEKYGNILWMTGCIHDKSDQMLINSKELGQNSLGAFTSPRVAVLLGAPHARHCPYDDVKLIDSVKKVANHVDKLGGSIIALGSRRTPPSSICKIKMLLNNIGISHIVWSPGDERRNPYIDTLAAADAIFVTPDSITMTCEALSSNPKNGVYSLMSDVPRGKFKEFFEDLWVVGDAGNTKNKETDVTESDLWEKENQETINLLKASSCTRMLLPSKRGDRDLENIINIIVEAVKKQQQVGGK
jgi:mitochondrial fission protein ELM1